MRPALGECLYRFLVPRSVAVIGASRDPAKLGGALLRNALANGFRGRLYPVNPHGGTICGLSSVARVTEIDEPVDLALVVVPAARSIEAFRDCAAAGIPAVVGITSGFAEAGARGAAFQAALRDTLETAPYRLIGPNSEGIVAPGAGVQFTFSPMFDGLRDGPVRILSQSGALLGMMASRLRRRGVGIGALISTGNEEDVTAAELIECFAEDPGAGVVLAYLEEIRDAPRFVRAARELNGRKMLVVEKAGRARAGRRAVLSHTGALAGDDRVADGVFRELGIVRVRDSVAAIDATAALAMRRRLRGRRIAVISVAGGLAVEMADLAESAGFELPEFGRNLERRLRSILPFYGAAANPIDLTGSILARPEMFDRVLEIVLTSRRVDALVIIVTFVGDRRIAEAVVAASRATDKPILFCWTGGNEESSEVCAVLHRHGLATFESPAGVLTGLEALRAEARLP